MFWPLALAAVSAELPSDAKLCVDGLNTYLRDEGVGCYFGSEDSRRSVLEAVMGGVLSSCDLTECRCSRNQTAGVSCEGFAVASLTGYINIHSDSAPINDLYEDMKSILQNECMENTNQAGVPSNLLLSPSYGMCRADDVVSPHLGGIGAYVAVYAALFTLVMVESTERSRYVLVPTEEKAEATAEAPSGEETGVAATTQFL